MKKTAIIIILIVLINFLGYITANDCNIASIGINGNFPSLNNWKYDNILPQEAMTKAMTNLKSFCCSEKLLHGDTCNKDSAVDTAGIFPSSAFLYDHILDVSMRRLDAKVQDDNGEDLLYGLTPDEGGENWREFISKQGNSKNGTIPLQIRNKFKENREIGNHLVKKWSKIDNRDRDDKTFESYNDWKLIDKYNSVCETSIYLYLSLASNTDNTKLGNAYDKCKSMVQYRVKKEFDYTNNILMQKGNKLLFNNIQSYLEPYFAQNKLVALQELVFNIKNTFNEINKAIIKLVPKCG